MCEGHGTPTKNSLSIGSHHVPFLAHGKTQLSRQKSQELEVDCLDNQLFHLFHFTSESNLDLVA